MLRNVLVMAASGIVLFSKEYANAVAQVRNGLLAAVELSRALSLSRSLSLGVEASAVMSRHAQASPQMTHWLHACVMCYVGSRDWSGRS